MQSAVVSGLRSACRWDGPAASCASGARCRTVCISFPRGSIYTTIMELGPQNHNRDGLSVPNSVMAVYMDPLGFNASVNRYTEMKH